MCHAGGGVLGGSTSGRWWSEPETISTNLHPTHPSSRDASIPSQSPRPSGSEWLRRFFLQHSLRPHRLDFQTAHSDIQSLAPRLSKGVISGCLSHSPPRPRDGEGMRLFKARRYMLAWQPEPILDHCLEKHEDISYLRHGMDSLRWRSVNVTL